MVPPLVPGFIATGGMSTNATGSQWPAVRSGDGHRFVLKVVPVTDVTHSQALAARQQARYDLIENEHLVRRHEAIALADGTLALVLDEVSGGSLAHLIAARGQLTVGETVTTVVPLFRALADLHEAGVVHGDLAPGNVLFSSDGRPLIGDLGVADLLGRQVGPFDGTSGFVAPELVDGLGDGLDHGCDVPGDGAAPSPASDVYAMAALGWFCFTGAPPGPAATRSSLATLRPDTPPALVELLTAALATDPAARPSAGDAAVGVFDSAPAESVALATVSDPAAEITRRIRAAAKSAPDLGPPGTRKKHSRKPRMPSKPGAPRFRTPLLIGLAILVAVALGIGATWFLRRPTPGPQPLAVKSAPQTPPPTVGTASRPSLQSAVEPTKATKPSHQPAVAVGPTKASKPSLLPAIGSAKASQSVTDVGTASSSPRVAPSTLLQALVDTRALAYVARDSALLALVYAPGAQGAVVDRGNITAAVKNGGTYLGLSYVVKNVTFLDGTSKTARIKATMLTPAYRTGQPDGRRIPHAQEILGLCIFTLSKTPDGWRILDLTVP